MTILHLTFDHPDSIYGKNTKAVKELIQNQQSMQNIIFSLNRTANPFKKLKKNKEKYGYAIEIFGLPYGILLLVWMFFAYKKIDIILKNIKIQPSLIHAHKLTFEGTIAFFLARKLKVPFIVTIRGGTDVKVLKYTPHYRYFYKKIVNASKKLIILAPWVVKKLNRYLGKAITTKSIIIPNIIEVNKSKIYPSLINKSFLTVLNFNFYKIKNIKRIIKACDQVFEIYPDYTLDIVGSGTSESINRIKSFIQKTRYPQNFNLLGKIEHNKLLKKYPHYKGFILPSYPETFGMVLVEALAGGIPIIYAKNSGIDGFFDGWNIGIKVWHKSVDNIFSGILEIIENNEKFRNNIKNMISSGYLEQFTASQVQKKYTEIINLCIKE